MMRSMFCVSLYATMALMCLMLCGSAAGQPSPALDAALNAQLDSGPDGGERLCDAVPRLYGQLWQHKIGPLPRMGVEYIDDAPDPRVKATVPAGTLRQQLDAIASGAGYVWLTEGECINLVPRSCLNDPDYVMNRRVDRALVFSRDGDKATGYKDWLTAQGISVGRLLGGMRLVDASGKAVQAPSLLADPTVLENPTLRQAFNAHEGIWGNDIWTVHIRTIPGEKGEKPRYSLLVWGQSLKPVPLPTTPSK